MIKVGFDTKNSTFVLFTGVFSAPKLNRKIIMVTTKGLSMICKFRNLATKATKFQGNGFFRFGVLGIYLALLVNSPPPPVLMRLNKFETSLRYVTLPHIRLLVVSFLHKTNIYRLFLILFRQQGCFFKHFTYSTFPLKYIIWNLSSIYKFSPLCQAFPSFRPLLQSMI